jgi:hypothetical protein
MQNDRTCPVCRRDPASPPDAARPGCPHCQPRPKLLRRAVQTVLVLGFLIATTGAAGLFALSSCPCSPAPVRPAPEELPKNLSIEQVAPPAPDGNGVQPSQQPK